MPNTRKITTAVCVAPRDHSPGRWQPSRTSLSRAHDQHGRTVLFSRWFLGESRPALYRPPVFLSEDPSATLSPSALYCV